jgi:phage terminase large subunit-like protein
VNSDRVIGFISKLRQTKGRWAGQPFQLLDWQVNDVVRPVFDTLRSDGRRRYRTAYIEVPRKNGKSTLVATLALYLLAFDGEYGGEVYSAASDKDQAALTFDMARDIVLQTPGLSGKLKVLDSRKRIVHTKTGSFYRAIPADAAGSHGFNASAVIVDELHVQPNRDLLDVLMTSTGARSQPLLLMITTAGFDRNSICYEYHDYALKVRSGVIDDPSFLGVIYSADEQDDWKSPATWRKANPSLGATITEEFLASECRRAQELPAYENTFKRLYLNIWTSQETRWIPLDKWDACSGALPELDGRACYAGLDLASTTDLAALVLVFPSDDDPPIYDVLPFFFVPADNVQERVRRDRVPYDVWTRQGHVIATEGNVIDYKFILAKLDELAQVYDIRELAYDRWGATKLIQDIQEQGLEVVPFGQGFASMSPPTKELLNLVLSQRIRHGANPVLRWMADNVMVRTDPAGNLKPDKSKSKEKIDGVVATIMALDRAIRNEGTSIYDTPERDGLLLL